MAHNVATSHVVRQRRVNSLAWVSLEELQERADPAGSEDAAGNRHAIERLLALVQELRPLDRQVILSYLEGMDAASIGEITGLSAGNVATKIHRIKDILGRRFHEGVRHG